MERHESAVDCPYCGEPITLLVEEGDIGVDYTEDCSVCCRPMVVDVRADGRGGPLTHVYREDE